MLRPFVRHDELNVGVLAASAVWKESFAHTVKDAVKGGACSDRTRHLGDLFVAGPCHQLGEVLRRDVGEVGLLGAHQDLRYPRPFTAKRMLHNGPMVEFTEWATEILQRSAQAAQRFNPDARVRLARVGATVQAVLTDQPEASDERVDLPGAVVFVEQGLEGLVDIEEPHDRVVLKPLGSRPNERGHH
jgi:hypothetical protein